MQEQNEHIWKIKWELAVQGSPQAQQEILSHIKNHREHPIFNEKCNTQAIFKKSKFQPHSKGTIQGTYEVYSETPIVLLLKGKVKMTCINLEGDEDNISMAENTGILEASKELICDKYGENNVNLLTKFQIITEQDSFIILLNPQEVESALKKPINVISLREESIMKRYMLFAIKSVLKKEIQKSCQCPLEQKFYLLQGKACFYDSSEKLILSCYEQGYFNPNEFKGTSIVLFLFANSRVLVFQEEFLKDETVAAAQAKRKEHIDTLKERYKSLSTSQKTKIQQNLIKRFQLDRPTLDKFVYKVQTNQEILQKKGASKKELGQTSSSMKEKCGIRIRKTTRKVI